jgi:hypothetical protein
MCNVYIALETQHAMKYKIFPEWAPRRDFTTDDTISWLYMPLREQS